MKSPGSRFDPSHDESVALSATGVCDVHESETDSAQTAEGSHTRVYLCVTGVERQLRERQRRASRQQRTGRTCCQQTEEKS